jgi:hypothetical protein
MIFDYFSIEFSGGGDTLVIETLIYSYPRELPTLSDNELALVPDIFRCFVDGENHPKSEFGGEVLRQRICRRCYPWVDEQAVGAMMRHDLRYGFATSVRE